MYAVILKMQKQFRFKNIPLKVIFEITVSLIDENSNLIPYFNIILYLFLT